VCIEENPLVTYANETLGQLQKMGILESKQKVASSTKRRSTQLDFSNLAPLKSGGTVGFSAFRDHDISTSKTSKKSLKKTNGSSAVAIDEDSDEEDEDSAIVTDMVDVEDKDVKTMLSPEDAKFTGELADGVGRIKVHSMLQLPRSLLISLM